MKRLYGLCLLLTFCCLLWAAPLQAASPEGFVGVPWGASRAQVKQLMSERGWLQHANSHADEEAFKGAFDGHEGDLHFAMAGNAFVEGSAIPLARFPTRAFASTKHAYEATVQHLSQKYGPPTKTGFDSFSVGHMLVWGQTTSWEFGDGITADQYRIRVILNSEGTWFSDVDGQHTYFAVIYEAVSLRERLKKQNI